jgi:putative NADH-flavin reductase
VVARRLDAAPSASPEDWKPEAIAHTEALDYYRSVEDLDWTFVSPAAFIHPGERTGRYRLGGDQLLVDDNGNSEVSAEDYAIAIADLLETGGRERERITVAW